MGSWRPAATSTRRVTTAMLDTNANKTTSNSQLPTPRARRPHLGNWELGGGSLIVLLVLAASVALDAHGVSGKDAVFLQGLKGRAIGPLLYLGAKHMVTGYDHLLFLVGVIFFLYRLKDVVTYVSLFTIGHSITLLAGVLCGIRANPFLIDAIICFPAVYHP